MKFSIAGIGAWGPGFNNWQDLSALLNGKLEEAEQASSPKPEIIPTNERRRAPLPVKLAVEVAWQASQAAGMDPKNLTCVFGSGLGDTDITDYMCRELNTDTKQLSPTKFHNSVHNAAAGYWTISTECMQAANSIAGFEQTASLALLEGVTQCVFEQRPLLITLFDAPVADMLKDILKNELPFAAALVITPQASGPNGFEMEIRNQAVKWNPLSNAALAPLYENNPAAKILSLFEFIAGNKKEHSLSLPLSTATSLTLRAITT